MNDYHQLIADSVVQHAEKLGRLIDYVEVGVLTGNSALAVLSTCKVRKAILIDNFSNTHCGDSVSSKAIAQQNLKAYEGLFDIIKEDSRVALPLLRDEKFDIGFVDGDHTNSACLADMENMLPLIRKDGVMFVDDIDNPGYHLRPVVQSFANYNKLKLQLHNVHNGLGELTRC